MTFGSARPFNVVVRALLAMASLAALSSEGLSAREQRPPGRTRPPIVAAPADPKAAPAIPAPPASAAPIDPAAPPAAQPQPSPPAPVAPAMPQETVEADVSTRSVAITSAFRGTEIVVFGTVNHSRQESAESGLYDIVVVVEGASAPLVARRKSNVAGIWLNTSSLRFDRVPTFYAISSTRPIDEVADLDVLQKNRIGFEHARIETAIGAGSNLTANQREEFTQAVIRLKRKEGLYFNDDYSVTFVGRALFRATIAVPANVPVGALVTRVYLFRDGEMLSQYTARVTLARQGFDNLVYLLAFGSPLVYGIVAVTFAVAAGLLASALMGRTR